MPFEIAEISLCNFTCLIAQVCRHVQTYGGINKSAQQEKKAAYISHRLLPVVLLTADENRPTKSADQTV